MRYQTVFFSPVFEGKVLSAHDIDTWKGMSKEVRDHRSETGEEALWTKRMFSGMLTIKYLLVLMEI